MENHNNRHKDCHDMCEPRRSLEDDGVRQLNRSWEAVRLDEVCVCYRRGWSDEST